MGKRTQKTNSQRNMENPWFPCQESGTAKTHTHKLTHTVYLRACWELRAEEKVVIKIISVAQRWKARFRRTLWAIAVSLPLVTSDRLETLKINLIIFETRMKMKKKKKTLLHCMVGSRKNSHGTDFAHTVFIIYYFVFLGTL